MFESLTERLSGAVNGLRGRGRLTDDNIGDALRQVRMALLEADVAVPVVKAFTSAVKARALGQEVTRSLTPGQAFIKIIHDELVRVMGEPAAGLNIAETRELSSLIATVKKLGITVLLVEHDMSLVMDISDEILVLNEGRKLIEGAPRDIQRHPDVIRVYLGEDECSSSET